MEGSQITRGRERPLRTIRETIEKDLEVNEFDKDMINDSRTLRRRLIHLTDST